MMLNSVEFIKHNLNCIKDLGQLDSLSNKASQGEEKLNSGIIHLSIISLKDDSEIFDMSNITSSSSSDKSIIVEQFILKKRMIKWARNQFLKIND